MNHAEENAMCDDLQEIAAIARDGEEDMPFALARIRAIANRPRPIDDRVWTDRDVQRTNPAHVVLRQRSPHLPHPLPADAAGSGDSAVTRLRHAWMDARFWFWGHVMDFAAWLSIYAVRNASDADKSWELPAGTEGSTGEDPF